MDKQQELEVYGKVTGLKKGQIETKKAATDSDLTGIRTARYYQLVGAEVNSLVSIGGHSMTNEKRLAENPHRRRCC